MLRVKNRIASLPLGHSVGRPADLSAWFASGVEAVALGSTLFNEQDLLHPGHAEQLEPYLHGITTNQETL